MLSQFATQLQENRQNRYLYFLLLTLTTVALIGYNFGAFDEAMHVPFVHALVDPALFPNDPSINLHGAYYSYFWLFFEPFARIGQLEVALFFTHLFSVYLTFWAIWELSKTLFNKPLASLFATLGFTIIHLGFVGFPIIEFAPLARTLALPFLLVAVNQFLKSRVWLAFLIAGLMYNVHVVSVNFALAMFGFACVLEWKRIGWKQLILSGVLFVVAALPVLIWKSSGGEGIDFSLRPVWLDFLNRSLFNHLFVLVSDYPQVWVLTSGGFSVIAMFFLAYPKHESRFQFETARNFIYGALIVLAVHFICVAFLPVTIIIQSQISRVGLWILIFAYIFFANYLAEAYESRKYSPRAFWLLAGTYLAAPFPLMLLAVWWIVSKVKDNVIALRTTRIMVIAVFLASIYIAYYINFYEPGIYIYGKRTPWVQTQDWARDNTPKDAKFITPPEIWSIQKSDWRVHSQRAPVVTLSEILMAAFQPGYEIEWITRFEDVAPGALAQFKGNYFNNVQFTRIAYNNLSEQTLLNLACKYDADYAVMEKATNKLLPVLYQNSVYAVYDVKCEK